MIVSKKKAVYPYIVVGETNVTPEETANSMKEDVAITIHVYSQTYNRDEAARIIRDIAFVVNRKLNIPDYEFIRSRISVQQVITDIDRYTKHGILRLLLNIDIKHDMKESEQFAEKVHCSYSNCR